MNNGCGFVLQLCHKLILTVVDVVEYDCSIFEVWKYLVAVIVAGVGEWHFDVLPVQSLKTVEAAQLLS